MRRQRNKEQKKGRNRPPSPTREWVGGRIVSPFYITEGKPYRPELILWLELPEDLVVSFTLIDPKEAPVSFGDTLIEAMESPMVGPPRRPSSIRVADPELATEVQRILPDVEVVKAPTPELYRVLEHMAESQAESDESEVASYLEDGRLSTELIEDLFRAAKLLYRIAPWKLAGASQVLRLDIPQLGVEGACVSIIGALGESIGMIIFPSLVAFESFLETAPAQDFSDGPIDQGTTTLSLNFERGADLPASMLREAVEHGWPVAGPDAYPFVQHRDQDAVPRPLSEHDIRVVSSCATSLATLFVKHRDIFEPESLDEPVCESFFDEDDLEVRFTVPYEAGAMFKANDPRPMDPVPASQPRRSDMGQAKAGGKVGRNEPCPCGSGKKYKRCCLQKIQAAEDGENAPAAIHEVDARLVEQMMRYAERRFGMDWFWRAGEDFDDPELSMQLSGPWAVYHIPVEGKPIVQWFLDDRKHQLSVTERTLLEAQKASWLSVWEVRAVEVGRSVTLKDLLTDEERVVRDIAGSKALANREVLLARVVDHQGLSVFIGVHPRTLPPEEADAVVQQIRGRLQRRRAVSVDRLQDEKIGRYMIRHWEEAVEDLVIRASIPPKLQNTDGDDLLLTVDHFEFDPANHDELEKALASIEDVDTPERDGPNQAYVFTRPGNPMHQSWDNTLIGRAAISKGKLRLETNSVARADALRGRVEAATGSLLRFRAREHSDPIAQLKDRRGRPSLPTEADQIPPEERNRMVLEMKTRHYAHWAEHPVPALDGMTPREAVRTKHGRAQVSLLLKSCENSESRAPEGQRFDFTKLRRELRLED